MIDGRTDTPRSSSLSSVNVNVNQELLNAAKITKSHYEDHGDVVTQGALQSSSSRMRVIYHNWSATKQRPHPQSVAEISRHSVLSGDRIRQRETSSGSRHKDTDQCL